MSQEWLNYGHQPTSKPTSHPDNPTAGYVSEGPSNPSDELTHYTESTSRLRAERDEWKNQAAWEYKRCREAQATMREVAEELRKGAALARTGEGSPGWQKLANGLDAYADLLDPPPVVDDPPA